MDKKGMELPASKLIILIILILFLVVMLVLYSIWGGQAGKLLDYLFDLFGR